MERSSRYSSFRQYILNDRSVVYQLLNVGKYFGFVTSFKSPVTLHDNTLLIDQKRHRQAAYAVRYADLSLSVRKHRISD